MQKYRDIYYTYCPDVDKNEGGYLIQLYLDEELNKEVDYMVIHNDNEDEIRNPEETIKTYIDNRHSAFLTVAQIEDEDNLERLGEFIKNNPDEDIASFIGTIFGDINEIKESIDCDLTVEDVSKGVEELKHKIEEELGLDISLISLKGFFDMDKDFFSKNILNKEVKQDEKEY